MAVGKLNPMWIVAGVIVLMVILNWNKGSSCGKSPRRAVRAGEKLFVPSLEYQQLHSNKGITASAHQIDLAASKSRMFTVASSFRDTRKSPVGGELRI